jgi:hypothetical protein
MADDGWSAASLRVFSDHLTPEELAAALGIRPDDSYRVGDRVSQRANPTAVRKTNAVFIHSGLAKSSPLEDHLSALLAKLGNAGGLRSLAGRAKMDVFCGFSSGNGQGGFTLSPELLSRLAALGVEVGFDLYPLT